MVEINIYYTLAPKIEPMMIYIYIVLLCFQNSCHLLSYCCKAVENLSRNRARIVFQTKGVIKANKRGQERGEIRKEE